MEGSLSGLEVAQSEGLRRLSMSISSALADAEASLQAGVRNEVARWVLDWLALPGARVLLKQAGELRNEQAMWVLEHPAAPRAWVEAGGGAERGVHLEGAGVCAGPGGQVGVAVWATCGTRWLGGRGVDASAYGITDAVPVDSGVPSRLVQRRRSVVGRPVSDKQTANSSGSECCL